MSLFNVRDTEHYEYPQLSIFYDCENTFNTNYLSEQFNEDSENAIYIHIPFCQSFCIFCNYYKERIDRNNDKIQTFIKTINKELDYYSNNLPPVYKKIKAIHFGGGTPTSIGIENLEQILNTIRTKFYLTDNCLISIESHVKDLCQELFVKNLKKIGFNRISFGIQSFSDDLRRKYGLVSLDSVNKTIEMLIKYEINDFNVDIMYGFPEQSYEEVISDIEKAFDMGCNCIDLYALNIFPETRMEKLLKKTGTYKYYIDMNIKNSYKNIYKYIDENREYNLVMSNTISKKSKTPNDYLRIHLGANKFEGGYIIGIGPSARGYLGGYSYKNHINLDEYIDKVNKKNNARFMENYLSQDEKQNRTMVMFPNYTYILKQNLRRNKHIDKVLDMCLKENIIKENEERYYIDPMNCFWAGNISAMFSSNEQRKKMTTTAIMNRRSRLNMYNQDKMQIVE